MRILITKCNLTDYDGIIVGVNPKSEDFKKIVKIDPFVGCYYSTPENYSAEELNIFYKSLVGTVLNLKDDCYKTEEGIYCPQEYDFI